MKLINLLVGICMFQIGGAYEPYPVGELGPRWTLGSDHLPVGGTVGSLHLFLAT